MFLVLEGCLPNIRVTPPAAPSFLIAEAFSSGAVKLMWGDASNNEEGFKIERKEEDYGSWLQIATVGANITEYTDQIYWIGTYYYRVKAYNSAGESDYSNMVKVTFY
jgi:hypothetical protein